MIPKKHKKTSTKPRQNYCLHLHVTADPGSTEGFCRACRRRVHLGEVAPRGPMTPEEVKRLKMKLGIAGLMASGRGAR